MTTKSAPDAIRQDLLAEPFTDEVKSRQGRGGMMFDYIDSRTAMQRMDEVLGIQGWEFRIKTVVGSAVVGTLTVWTESGPREHEDVGYPNGPDDEEPLKSAVSDCIKRCAVQIGVGRHLYFDAVPQPAQAPSARQRPSESATANASGISVREMMQALEDRGIDTRKAGDAAKQMFGDWKFSNLSAEQRAAVLEEVSQPSSGIKPMGQPKQTEEPADMQADFDSLPF